MQDSDYQVSLNRTAPPLRTLYSIHFKIIQGQRTEYNLLERELEEKVLQKQERLGFDPGLRRLPLACRVCQDR